MRSKTGNSFDLHEEDDDEEITSDCYDGCKGHDDQSDVYTGPRPRRLQGPQFR